MKTPPFLLAAALLVWASSAHTAWLAAPLALALELSRWRQVRWDLGTAALDRLWNLCVGMLLLHGLYLVASDDQGLGLGAWMSTGTPPTLTGNRATETLRQALLFLPLWVAPMILAQTWGRMGPLPVSTFSWYLRLRRNRWTNTGEAEERWDISWPYFAITVVGACAAEPTPLRLDALVLLVGWALWTRRSHAFPAWAWAGTYLTAVGLAALLHAGLRPVEAWLNEVESNWLNRWFERQPGAAESHTTLGMVGRRKNSGRIAFRLQTPPGAVLPTLLWETVHDTYRGTVWKNEAGPTFTPVSGGEVDGTYPFASAAGREAFFHLWLPPGSRSIVPQPFGLRRLEEVHATGLESNALGVLRANDWKFGAVPVFYGRAPTVHAPPTPKDLSVPDAELPVLSQVANELGLTAPLAPAQKLALLGRYFSGNFAYSLYQSRAAVATTTRSTLEAFLLRTHSGHCEYFATATTLLLRQAGIPARYVVGWAVPSPVADGLWTLVRDRHAHAWTLAFIDGRWCEVDNTPASWNEAENQRRSAWESVTDGWSRLVFEWGRLRLWGAGGRTGILLIAGLLLVGLLIQWLRANGGRRSAARTAPTTTPTWPGLDSEFYAIVRALERTAGERAPGETLRDWLPRVHRPGNTPAAPEMVGELSTLLALHYRLRFDPASLTPTERHQLRQQAEAWLRSR